MPELPSAGTMSTRVVCAAFLCVLAIGMSSCVPLMIGAAVGYIARDEGLGTAPPMHSGDTYDATVQDPGEAYEEPDY